MAKQKRIAHKFFLLIAIASLILMSSSVNLALSAWPPTPSNVSANAGRSTNSSIAVDKSGAIHVVWEDEDREIYYRKSSDGGTTWSTPAANVSRSVSASRLPKIAVAPDGSLGVVWVEFTTNWEIFYSQFKNNTWSTPVNVSSTSLSMSDYPRLAVDASGKIHVVWQDNNEVAYSSSNDGQTWSKPNVILTSGGEVIEPPALSASGNNVHLVWQRVYVPPPPNTAAYYDIRYRMYNGSTGTWDPTPTTISGGSTVYRGNPGIAADVSGKPHVIWVDESTPSSEIMYSRLEGTSWITPYVISNTPTASGRPAIAADSSGNLHAVWDESVSSEYDIYYSRFNGGSWSYRENVLDNPYLSQAASVAGDGTANPNIVWEDSGSGNGDILFARGSGSITVFSDDFEYTPLMSDPASGWVIGADPYPGQPSPAPYYWAERTDDGLWDTAHSGLKGAWAGNGTTHQYVPYMNSYARTTFDLTNFASASLSFWYRVNTTDYPNDLGVLNVVLNGNFVSPARQILYGYNVEPWTLATVDLTPYVGNRVTLEWRWISDGDTTVGEGMFIDDISVTGNVRDGVAPSVVSNLSASNPSLSSLNLSWTAPGDDGTSGTATTYDVRYSTSAINDANWASATQATGEPAPKIAGSSETFTVTGLSPGTTYYFALKTADERGNWSYLSNVPSAQTASNATVVLGTGWNLVSLPHAPVAALKAQDVLNNINANAGATIATQISRWNNASGIWQSRIDGFPPLLNNFDVVLGEGYFIKVSAPGNWSIVGTHLTSPVTLNLGTGWNLSAVPYSSTAYKAQDLINGIKAQGGTASQVSRWNNASGIWQSRIDGFPPLLNNFDIVSGEGYFIKTASSSTFTP